jgi:hypothetical protein
MAGRAGELASLRRQTGWPRMPANVVPRPESRGSYGMPRTLRSARLLSIDSSGIMARRWKPAFLFITAYDMDNERYLGGELSQYAEHVARC